MFLQPGLTAENVYQSGNQYADCPVFSLRLAQLQSLLLIYRYLLSVLPMSGQDVGRPMEIAFNCIGHSRVMISKPIYNTIPSGGERLYQERLPERDPNIINHKISAFEVRQI